MIAPHSAAGAAHGVFGPIRFRTKRDISIALTNPRFHLKQPLNIAWGFYSTLLIAYLDVLQKKPPT